MDLLEEFTRGILVLVKVEKEKTHFRPDALLRQSKLYLQKVAEVQILRNYSNNLILTNTEKSLRVMDLV